MTPSCSDAELADKSIPGFFEQQYGATQIYTKDERIDGRIALQWHPSEDVMLTLDDNYSRQKIRSDNFGYGIWFNQGSLRNVDLDENGTVLDFTQDGSQTDFTAGTDRSYLRPEEHTSELQSLMSNSYAVFRLKKKK